MIFFIIEYLLRNQQLILYVYGLFINHIILKEKKMQSKSNLSDFNDFMQIGQGAFGKVYRATLKKTKRKFALKKMSKKDLKQKEMISQINNEIKISDSLKHENIIKLYDCFQDEDYIYLVLELAEHGQLFSKLRKVGKFDEQTVKTMILDVIAAVQYLHSRNPAIIHRDIKPQNLLLDKSDRVKLAGMSFLIEDFGWSNFSNMNNKPRKTYCGTVDYLAPEMINKTGHDEKLDIWCIGVLVYELLTGKTPFMTPSSGLKKEQAKKLLEENILNVRIQFPEDFPPEAKDFVLGMIRRNPKQRMSFKQIRQHPWLKAMNQSNIPTKTFKQIEKIDESVEIISELKTKIAELEEELQYHKSKSKDEEKNWNQDEYIKLKNEVGKLRIAQQMNEKYKKNQDNLWDQKINRDKQIIHLKNELKKMDDLEEDLNKVKKQRDSLLDKVKKLKKEKQNLEEKNHDLEEELETQKSTIHQRVKNGEKISMKELSSPEFVDYLQNEISELAQKFEKGKEVLSKVLEKEKFNREKNEQLIRLKTQEKNMRDNIRAELRDIYENEKDQILLKARNELFEEKQKWFKERQTLKLLYENGSSTQESSTQGDKTSDMEKQLINMREILSYNEKKIKEQETIISDLKEEVKRKK